jgi:hypothetical protein
MSLDLGVVLESHFHKFDCVLQRISDFNGDLVVCLGLIDHLFKMNVGFC